MSEPNPYAPPEAPPDAPPPRPGGRYAWIKWLYLGGSGLEAIAFVAGALGVGGVPAVAFTLFAIAKGLVGALWQHRVWSTVPRAFRTREGGQTTTPGMAAGRLVIPLYNFYWMFAVNLRLCAALNDMNAGSRSSGTATASYAMTAAAMTVARMLGALGARDERFVTVVWYAPIPIGIVWFVHMVHCDARLDRVQRV